MDSGEEEAPRGWAVGYAAGVRRFRWLIILLTLAVIGFFAYGISFIRLDADTRLFFDAGSQEIANLNKYENTYTRADSVVFIVSPREGDVYSADTLTAVRELTDRSWQIPHSTRVSSLANFPYSRSSADEVVVEPVLPAGPQIDAELVRKRAADAPGVLGNVITKDGAATLVSVMVIAPEGDTEAIPTIAIAAQNLAREIERQHPGIVIRLTGGVIAGEALAEATQYDIINLIPFTVLLVVAVLWVGLRSAYAVFATLLVIAFSMIVAVGAAGWQGMVINNITAGAPILTMTLAIADCVHILAGIGQLRRKGTPADLAVVISLRNTWWPVLLTSITTAVSFLTMNFADSPPLRQMGTLVAVGVTAAWILSMTFFPALLWVLRPPKKLPVLSDPRFMTAFAGFVIRFRRPILAGMLVLVAAAAAGIPRLVLNDDFFKYFSTSFAFRQATDYLDQHGLGLHVIQVSVESGKDGGIADPEYLAKLEAFGEWLKQYPYVSSVSVFTDTLKRLNRNMNGDDPAFERLPKTREAAAQYLLFYEMSLPADADLTADIDIAKSSTAAAVYLRNANSTQIRELAEAIDARLKADGLGGYATGISVLYAYLAQNNIEGMIWGTLIELVVISLLMIGVLRSFRIGILSLVPNLVPAILAAGIWGWWGAEVNMAISVVAAMTFGIIVDDTIHSLTKYMHARRKLQLPPSEAVEYTFVSAGDPMILTGLTLVLGFGVLSFSGFAVTHHMGLLSTLTLSLAIVADLVLLPPLLLLFDRQKGFGTKRHAKT